MDTPVSAYIQQLTQYPNGGHPTERAQIHSKRTKLELRGSPHDAAEREHIESIRRGCHIGAEAHHLPPFDDASPTRPAPAPGGGPLQSEVPQSGIMTRAAANSAGRPGAAASLSAQNHPDS